MVSFCVEEQKGLAYHLDGLRVPLVVRVPQFGNHCFISITLSTAIFITRVYVNSRQLEHVA